MDDMLARHERIALQFSGGKDSLACLYLLKPYWDRLTVYWLNTGAAYPETVALMDKVRSMVPRFIEVAGRQPQVIEQFGIPSDLVPASATPIGITAAGGGLLLQDRYSCCARSMMIPMQERMIEDGITLVIRGQKQADSLKWPLRSGQVVDGVEYLFPIEDWSSRQVMDFLKQQGAPIPRFYEVISSAPDCMTCSAWWEEGAAKYLKRYHHEHYLQYQGKLDAINAAVSAHIANFNDEVNE
ncbi:MAG TPA: phosphoadenosine phosphosulfate reductase family protein [Noviherbaspirillum sp.]|nr:phosphoadenosine phosphosulfate reductase family protein [Noviherbaspirillum sp.]